MKRPTLSPVTKDEQAKRFHPLSRLTEESNPIVRMLVCGCRCCLWCLEKVLQIITEYAYASWQQIAAWASCQGLCGCHWKTLL